MLVSRGVRLQGCHAFPSPCDPSADGAQVMMLGPDTDDMSKQDTLLRGVVISVGQRTNRQQTVDYKLLSSMNLERALNQPLAPFVLW